MSHQMSDGGSEEQNTERDHFKEKGQLQVQYSEGGFFLKDRSDICG